MRIRSIRRAATVAACALAVSAGTASAAPSSSGVNAHASPPGTGANAREPPADVAHRQAKEAVAHRPVMKQEDADYENAVKACKKLPLSERTTCISQAGNSATLSAKAKHEVHERR